MVAVHAPSHCTVFVRTAKTKLLYIGISAPRDEQLIIHSFSIWLWNFSGIDAKRIFAKKKRSYKRGDIRDRLMYCIKVFKADYPFREQAPQTHEPPPVFSAAFPKRKKA
jgi:hypothetical protein